MTLSKVISFQLKHLKLSNSLDGQSFDFESFINGRWRCEYRKEVNGNWGGESLSIEKGNNYLIKGQLVFLLTDIDVDEKNKQISWTKTSYPSGAKHSRETLSIVGDKELSGKDDVGFIIKYLKNG